MLFEIFKKFGYENIRNNECRHFFLSFHTIDSLDVKMSDGLNNNFNSYAFELYLKQIGQVIYKSENHQINLVYDTTR